MAVEVPEKCSELVGPYCVAAPEIVLGECVEFLKFIRMKRIHDFFQINL